MLLLIDNYDSFTYNLVHYFGELGEEVKVHRNDEITSEAVLDANPSGIILSPGPSEPSQAGICIDLICKAAGVIPVLGVCLGHQAIGEAFGGLVTRATPVHGKLSPINHDRSNIFEGLPSQLVLQSKRIVKAFFILMLCPVIINQNYSYLFDT